MNGIKAEDKTEAKEGAAEAEAKVEPEAEKKEEESTAAPGQFLSRRKQKGSKSSKRVERIPQAKE